MQPRPRTALLCSLLVAGWVPTGTARAAGETPPPTVEELKRLLAIERDILAEGSRIDVLCAEGLGDPADGEGPRESPEAIGRRLEGDAHLSPLFERHQLGGRRFVEVLTELGAGLSALEMAEGLDEGMQQMGQPATNRENLLRRSESARLAAAHREELRAVIDRTSEACGDAGDPADE